jgi:hypothetical protein
VATQASASPSTAVPDDCWQRAHLREKVGPGGIRATWHAGPRARRREVAEGQELRVCGEGIGRSWTALPPWLTVTLQVANFLVASALVLGGAVGVRRLLRGSPGAR